MEAIECPKDGLVEFDASDVTPEGDGIVCEACGDFIPFGEELP